MDYSDALQNFHLEELIACSTNGAQYMLVIQGEQHSGENVISVCVTNWVCPIWSSIISLRSVNSMIKNQGPATDLEKVLGWIQQSFKSPESSLFLQDDEAHLMGYFQYGNRYNIRTFLKTQTLVLSNRLPPSGSLRRESDQRSIKIIQGISMQLLDNVKRADAEQTRLQIMLEKERSEHTAVIQDLEKSLRRLQEEYIEVKAKVDMYEGRTFRDSPIVSKKARGAGLQDGASYSPDGSLGHARSTAAGGSAMFDLGQEPWRPKEGLPLSQDPGVSASTALAQGPNTQIEGRHPSGQVSIAPSNAGGSDVCALPALVVSGSSGRGSGRGSRGRLPGRSRLKS
ncbi:hypothetical protein CEUSTIGMA_g12488.t1 [Chlamydomonas eustigma]|uniref:Uncharacterized protein n=1 Tax=Chlamydomonas eustigma TaxID=1157962 RepID=A0A250XPT2_9CHLO|nr:hypothetical protein CEUSTIGMA_g12488.t1 [Chlamydomonas eustigma]|eukprot:GAX85068.1 hypothetical protein CEUSTIGMA_g12488.t1 [Chlamydomonas eustigma]